MNRFILALCVISLAACGAPPPAPFVFPQSIGVWKLKLVTDGAAPPGQIRRLAEYEGPGRMTAEVYQMTSSADALEAEQKWRPVADTVAFHQGSLFTIIHWESADRAAVTAFVREMQEWNKL